MRLGTSQAFADVRTISTGSIALDAALGIGGIPGDVSSKSTALKPQGKRLSPYTSLPKPKSRRAGCLH